MDKYYENLGHKNNVILLCLLDLIKFNSHYTIFTVQLLAYLFW